MVSEMILLLLCAPLFVVLGKSSDVIPHIHYPDPSEVKTSLTLRDPIYPGTVVWIYGLFYNDVFDNDLKVYVIAGGNGEFNDQMKAAVLEIRVYHDQDKITYGSLSHWGDKWNYAADSRNPIRDAIGSNTGYDFVLEFKDKLIVVWVNGQVLSIYGYSATIHDLSEISGIHIPQNDELRIIGATYHSSTPYGKLPYAARFDPPLSKDKQRLVSYGTLHCGEYQGNDVEFIFHNSTGPPKNFPFALTYNCQTETFVMLALIDGKSVGTQSEKYEASELKNGMVLIFEVDGSHVKVYINREDTYFIDFPHQIDIEKYPVTNLYISSLNGRYSMSILAMMDLHN